MEVLDPELQGPAYGLVERLRAKLGQTGRLTGQPLCYGVRRLNPFQGILQVVELGDARALSLDGVRWEIQVRCAQRLKHPDAEARVPQTRAVGRERSLGP